MSTRHFKFKQGGAHKFWEISASGKSFTVRFGRIGTSGQTKTKKCASPGATQATVAKLIADKLGKGYREVDNKSGKGRASPASKPIKKEKGSFSVKIEIRGATILYGPDDKKVTSPQTMQRISGVTCKDDMCSNYFDVGGVLDDAQVTGGRISLQFDNKKRRLEVVVTYNAPSKLSASQIQSLLEETMGQLSDGIGEGCFDPLPRLSGGSIDLCPHISRNQFRITQTAVEKRLPVQKVNIWAAAKYGDLEAIQRAIDAGMDLNAQPKGYTPLSMAVGNGQAEAVRLLLANGANVNRKNLDVSHFGPIHSCVASCNIKGKRRETVLLMLLDAGAKVNDPSRGGTPLEIAHNYGRGQGIQDILVAHGGVRGKKMRW